jgi:predicted permease
MLVKRPAFTLVAVFTLALGLSANATILGMIRSFFFQPLSVKDPERLVIVLQKTSVIEFPHGHSWLDYRDYRDRVREFEDVLALFLTPVHLGIPGAQAERTWIEAVSGNYFTMLGADAAVGRVFGPEEAEQVGGEPMVVLAHHYWESKFGGNPGVVGTTVQLNGRPYVVVGVTRKEFSGAQWSIGVSGWVPATTMGQLVENGEDLLNNRAAPAFKVMARLAPGVSVGQARAAVAVVARQLASEYPQEHREATLIVVPEMRSRPEPSFSQFMPFAAAMFMSLVVLVLLIACANVANLMFAHAIARRREMGIRAAVGATRWRLIRQILIESILIAVAGGILGDVLSLWTGSLLAGFAPSGDIPVRTDTSWDWVSSLLIILLAVGAGMVTGLAPALRATRGDLQTVLKEGGGTAVGMIRHPLRSLLVISQVALCVVVLVGGGLFLESLRQMARLDLGFQTGNLVMASLDLGLQRYDDERGRQFLHTLLERTRVLPGVESASVAVSVPFDYGVQLSDVGAEGQVSEGGEPGKDGYLVAGVNAVEATYHRTMGVTILQGREFNEFDTKNAPKVAIINQTLAERFWPGQTPIGKRFRFGRGGEFVEVVGLARDGKYVLLGEQPRPYLYLALDQEYRSPATLHVRAAGDPMALVPAIRRVLATLDPDLPVYNIRTMDEHLRQSAMAMMPLRMAAVLAGVQGALGLLLAMMGIYGVVSYVAHLRTREIGLRVALGARRIDVLRLVIREGWHLTLIGLGAGSMIALVMAMGLSRLLYGLNPFNLPVFGVVLVLLASVALVACFLPARRAARVDPMVALRCE